MYNGGYVNIGTNPGSNCRSVSISNGIYGVSYERSSYLYGMNFLSKCEYTDDPAGPAGPVDSSIILLMQSSQLFATKPPGITSNCWSVSYSLHRASDGRNLVSTYPSAFSDGGTSFDLTLAYSDSNVFTVRLGLFESNAGLESYYVKRTFSGQSTFT